MKQTQVTTGIVVQQTQQGPSIIVPNNSISNAMLQGGAVGPVNLQSSVSLYLLPVGAIIHYCGLSLPTGYLPCDGSVVSQSTYASLYAAIGTTFNTGGEGAGNFRMPDSRGRTLMGSGTGAGLTSRTVGQSIGEESHLLSVSEMPSHSHSDAGHSHQVDAFTSNDSFNENTPVSGGYGNYYPYDVDTGYANIQATGGGSAHNNIQPSLVIQHIIKY